MGVRLCRQPGRRPDVGWGSAGSSRARVRRPRPVAGRTRRPDPGSVRGGGVQVVARDADAAGRAGRCGWRWAAGTTKATVRPSTASALTTDEDEEGGGDGGKAGDGTHGPFLSTDVEDSTSVEPRGRPACSRPGPGSRRAGSRRTVGTQPQARRPASSARRPGPARALTWVSALHGRQLRRRTRRRRSRRPRPPCTPGPAGWRRQARRRRRVPAASDASTRSATFIGRGTDSRAVGPTASHQVAFSPPATESTDPARETPVTPTAAARAVRRAVTPGRRAGRSRLAGAVLREEVRVSCGWCEVR